MRRLEQILGVIALAASAAGFIALAVVLAAPHVQP